MVGHWPQQRKATLVLPQLSVLKTRIDLSLVRIEEDKLLRVKGIDGTMITSHHHCILLALGLIVLIGYGHSFLVVQDQMLQKQPFVLIVFIEDDLSTQRER